MMEQFQNCIDGDLRMWLLDQKPKILTETAKLAVPRQPSVYHRPPPDFRPPTRGKQIQRQPPNYRFPSVVIFRLPSSGFHLASPTATGQSHVMFLFAAALLCFSPIP